MTDEPTLSDDKWVRIMADFGADGVCDKEGASVDRHELPVSASLLDRLLAWQQWYDTDCEDYLPEDDRTTKFDIARFAAEGLAIAKAVKAELPDWTVVYFDEAKCPRALDGSRDIFEYEVAA